MRHLVILIVFTLASCSSEHRASYEPLPNDLPETSLPIQFSQTDGFLNLDAVRAQLSEQQKSAFDASLGWYATEADYDLGRLDGRSAREVVDIANCLKDKSAEEAGLCFE